MANLLPHVLSFPPNVLEKLRATEHFSSGDASEVRNLLWSKYPSTHFPNGEALVELCTRFRETAFPPSPGLSDAMVTMVLDPPDLDPPDLPPPDLEPMTTAPFCDPVADTLSLETRNTIERAIADRRGAIKYVLENQWIQLVQDSLAEPIPQCIWFSENLDRGCTYGTKGKPVKFRVQQPRFLCAKHLQQERNKSFSRYKQFIDEMDRIAPKERAPTPATPRVSPYELLVARELPP